MAELPYSSVAPNQTNLSIMFSTSNVILEREEKAFSFRSFVADVGGVLGLFIGFSFISLWDFILVWGTKLYSRCRKYKA